MELLSKVHTCYDLIFNVFHMFPLVSFFLENMVCFEGENELKKRQAKKTPKIFNILYTFLVS